ncbi:DMT family transporter [Jannaschia aquimarina]|uniref:EamA-like transporter family protein n=1 Tax=Jannaschia aquimarina TaxID=935700 RepID=A0A0D1CP67_9RHOB|nr:DMT family transporter [Jannaschia aquimarina]KIT16562.1 EamA-like transporter family protein [Jannaschia aquimarina]SNT41799.1 EamA-like transporter family protein [Jannaschia aquimarina]
MKTTAPIEPDRRGFAVGILAWIATAAGVTIWQLATRWGVTTTLTPLDLALFRYGVPGLVLAPLLWRRGAVAPDRPLWLTALIVLGAGLPFGLLAMAGAQFAPAAHMGALLPGAMPLFVAALSALVLGERFGGLRLSGLALVVVAVLCITGGSLVGPLDGRTLIGDGLFILAGVIWAIYTVAFRRSGLDPWHGAAIICGWSTVVVVPLWGLSDGTGLTTAPLTDVLIQIAVQGGLAGLFGMVVFGIAVNRLGASATALSGAVVPAATAVGGWLLLGETVTTATIVGIALVVVGLALYARGGQR